MYDELVKRLREHNGWALNKTLDEAADAIEELQKAVNFHKFNSEFWEDKYNSLADEKWIPVTERLPETDDDVVVAFKNSKDGEWWYRIDNFVDGAFCYNAAFGRNITHWMPLPEPPKEE